MLSLVGMQGITLHFDPDPATDYPVVPIKIVEPVKIPEKKKLPPALSYKCDHCTKLFASKSSVIRHKDWVKRIAQKKALEEKVYGSHNSGE